MGVNKLVYNFKDMLISFFVNSEAEWVDVVLEAGFRLDIKIVSDKTINKREAENFIKKSVEEINSNSDIRDFKLGFLEFYTIEESKLFDIVKPKRRNDSISSFGDMIDAAGSIELNKKSNKSKVISFYSYKGGVGRTIALIQSAYNLAKKGKRVVLMDLDIEAPSFSSIFKEYIKNDNGLINYLCNIYFKKVKNVINDDNNISSIVSKVNLNSDGEMFVVPAGKVDIRYVKQIQMLKENVISNNNYIREIIHEIVKEYDIDYVFIDSRTGINNWGALSIADIADEVFLVAYPNSENIEGIKLILDLINDIKKCTVIFSRIDPSNSGKINAKELFSQLNLEQEFIGIYYSSLIALSKSYPIREEINDFNVISDFILEEEVKKENIKWIKTHSNKVKESLEKLRSGYEFENIISSNEKKLIDSNNHIIVTDNKENIYNLIEYIDKSSIVKGLNQSYLRYMEDVIKINGSEELGSRYLEIILSILMIHLESLNIVDEFNKDDVIKKFIGYSENFVKNDNMEINEINRELNILANKINSNGYLLIDYKEIFEFLLRITPRKIIEEEERYNKNLINIIYILIGIFNLSSGIQVKLLLQYGEYTEYKEIISKNSSNSLVLSWKSISDVEEFSVLVKDVLRKTQDIIFENEMSLKNVDATFKEAINIFYNSIQEKLSNDNTIENDGIDISKFNIDLNNKKIDENLLNIANGIKYNQSLNGNLLYPNRIDDTKYSEEISYWIAKKLIKDSDKSKEKLLYLIKKAASIELDKNNEDIEKSSIITFDSLNKAMES